MEKYKIVNIGGINGLGEGLINTNSKDFKFLQAMIRAAASDQDEMTRIEYEFHSIRFQMESYLTGDTKETIPAGDFIEKFLSVLKVKKKDFAEYIDYEDTNLIALIKGRRKINAETAIKLGRIFGMDPAIWLNIENKNEILRVVKEEAARYGKYNLKDLMNKFGDG